MTITPTEIYWLLKLDAIQNLFTGLTTISAIAIIFFGVSYAIKIDFTDYNRDKEANEKLWSAWRKRLMLFSIVPIVFISLSTFIPSTKQMAAIMIAPPIINNEKVQQIPKDLLDILGLSIKKVKKKLKEETK